MSGGPASPPLVALDGLRLLVLGGGSGIGLATVRLAQACGARVAAGGKEVTATGREPAVSGG